GGDGGDMLGCGARVVAELSYRPRAGRAHALGLWFDVEHGGKPPERETGGAPGGQPPPNLVRLDDVETEEWGYRDMGSAVRALGRAAGSEEEVFVGSTARARCCSARMSTPCAAGTSSRTGRACPTT